MVPFLKAAFILRSAVPGRRLNQVGFVRLPVDALQREGEIRRKDRVQDVDLGIDHRGAEVASPSCVVDDVEAWSGQTGMS